MAISPEEASNEKLLKEMARAECTQLHDSENTGKIIESAILECKDYLDANFKREIDNDRITRLWELYLCKLLLGDSITIPCKREWRKKIPWKPGAGPDFQIPFKDGTIWIEAVVSKNWTEDHTKISEKPENEVFQITGKISDTRLSRLSNALEEKRKKFYGEPKHKRNGYIKDGIVTEHDWSIIALDGSISEGFFTENGIETVLYWLWRQRVVYWESGLTDMHFQRRDSIVMPKKEPIPIPFFTPENSAFSAVMYIDNWHPALDLNKWSSWVKLYHNPYATSKLPRWLFKFVTGEFDEEDFPRR